MGGRHVQIDFLGVEAGAGRTIGLPTRIEVKRRLQEEIKPFDVLKKGRGSALTRQEEAEDAP